MKTNKTDVETKGRALTMKRVFDASRELVFETFSSCEHLKHWWGPRTWPMVECTLDFREGGTWHYCLRGPNEEDASWGLAKYLEIVPVEKVVYDDYFSDEDANINEGMPGMRITVQFREAEGGTEITSTTQFASEADLEKVVEMGAVEGMTETWDRLEEHLASVSG